jgi:cyanophycinase
MVPTFLIGGGWEATGFIHTYGRFLQTAIRNTERRIGIVIAEEPGLDLSERFRQSRGVFESVGGASDEFFSLFVSDATPLTLEALASQRPTGIFVCGGLTPAYQRALCVHPAWVNYLHDRQIPYGGFSAGAAIAATTAIVGGWQRQVTQRNIVIADEHISEDELLIDVRAGLGLVPFAVDVHASQWGTLTRLLHSVDQGSVASGWAIDEDTMLEVDASGIHVHGLGHAYRVQRATSGALDLQIVRAGATFAK